MELAATLVEQKPSDTRTSHEQESHDSLLLISLSAGPTPGESKAPEGRMLLGWLESGNTQLGPTVTDCRNRMAAVRAHETPRQPHREGCGAVCLHDSVGPLFVTQKQQKKKEVEI